jgi:hypothetical protein
MKKIITLIIILAATVQFSKAQQVAMDFTMDDCYGQMHNLYTTLDSGYVVVMEFFMTCNSCITGGHEVEEMIAELNVQYPDKVKFYQMAYTNSYTCTSILDFVNDNGFNSVPFDSGAAMVAYYGGFGMPTFAVVGGSAHEVLYTGIGYSSGDQDDMAMAIEEFFMATTVNEVSAGTTSMNIFPNPVIGSFGLEMNLPESADVKVQLLSINGNILSTLSNEKLNAGYLQKTFSTASFPPGLYLLKTTVNGIATLTKLSIIR